MSVEDGDYEDYSESDELVSIGNGIDDGSSNAKTTDGSTSEDIMDGGSDDGSSNANTTDDSTSEAMTGGKKSRRKKKGKGKSKRKRKTLKVKKTKGSKSKRKKSKSSKTSPWIAHVKSYSAKNGMNYAEALTDPGCKKSYKK